ncbi:MAG: amidohydrolase family protein [Acidimicrobiia bacterium]
MATLAFRPFDADNHYYEATDAFTRHIPKEFAKRGVQWAEVNGRQRLLVGGRLNRFIPNPTFDPVARPGALDDYFRGKVPGDDIRAAFGDLEPIHPGYREPAARVAMLDDLGLDGAFLFPTLGVGMEDALESDPPAAHAVFHAFNQWLLDDWSFDFEDRLFAAPMISLLDPESAVAEVEWVLERGARVVVMRSGPVRAPEGHRSPGDAVYDPVWARLAEAGVLVAYHSGESGYGFMAEAWGQSAEFEAFRHDSFKQIITGHRPIHDTLAALVCHGVLARFPNLRVATIESGSDWVQPLLRSLGRAHRQRPGQFAEDPIDVFKRQVWVAPFYEDDLVGLRDAIGADHVLFGSDYPHAEGLADPLSFVDDLDGYTDDEIRLVMRENALALSRPAPA